MRKQSLVTDQYYHIYNRGVDKRDIFNSKIDIERFIESIVEFNQINRIGSLRDNYLNLVAPVPKALEKEKLVVFVGYCLNPNHFHFILKQKVDGGIAKFMQKLQAGYTYFFNVKNKRSGSLFQGTFKSHIITDNNYFNKILGYVNKNYEVHDIPQNKIHLVYAGDVEYKNKSFKIIDRDEAEKILEIFSNSNNFERHCLEIVSIIRKERGKQSLLDEDELPSA